uniref:Uncharacterized protein n=1 Tax=Meloidogyne incognita TaxID=6306 RepID=A0A914L1N3_MELIC
MGLLLINILTLFLLINVKFGDPIECYSEINLNYPNAQNIELTKCNNKEFPNNETGAKCAKNDCGEYGFYKGCGACSFYIDAQKESGIDEDCTCHECDTDLCNSGFGSLANLKIIFLFCLVVVIIKVLHYNYFPSVF